jgi:hypothetical protein
MCSLRYLKNRAGIDWILCNEIAASLFENENAGANRDHITPALQRYSRHDLNTNIN